MKNRLLILVLPLLFLLEGCDNPFAITPGTQGENIVTGIYKTNTSGEVYEVWGTPSSQRDGNLKSKDPDVSDEEDVGIPAFFSFEIPYPNPFVASTTVQFQLPAATTVSIWLETAYLPQSDYPLPNQNRVERSFRKIFLLKESRMAAGSFSVIFSTLLNEDDEFDENGEQIAPGFYRVFIQAGSQITFHDIYIGGKGVNPPPGLGDFLYH